jgi:hypothetical protein
MTTFIKKVTDSKIELTNNLERFSDKQWRENSSLEEFKNGMKILSESTLCYTTWVDGDKDFFEHCFLSNVKMTFTTARNAPLADVKNAVFVDTVLFSEADEDEDNYLTIWFFSTVQRDYAKRKFFTSNNKIVNATFVMPNGDLLEFRGKQDSMFWDD